MPVLAAAVLMVALAGTLAGAASVTLGQPVVVAGTVVLRIRAPIAGLSVAERAIEITHRVNRALVSGDLTPANFHIVPSGQDRIIKVGRIVLVTVTVADAGANQTTVQGLAEVWMAALRDALPRARPIPKPVP